MPFFATSITNFSLKPTAVLNTPTSTFNLEDRFDAIQNLLADYSHFWQKEVLSRYPNEFGQFPDEWIDELLSHNKTELYAIERQREFSMLRNSTLRAYFETITELECLPKAAQTPAVTLPHQAMLGVAGKKQYEIETLLPAICELHAQKHFKQVLDYAGGIGYFAQVLANHCGIPVHSLDFDARLQETGIKRFEKYRAPESANLQYEHCDLLASANSPKTSDNLHLGLHSCGSLSVEVLRGFLKKNTDVALSFGCCYYRTHERDLLLSRRAREKPLTLSGAALTLASRSHRDDFSAFELSKRVKLYRYMIHLYLHHEFGITEFKGLGNSSRALYRSEFEEYGVEQLKRLGIANAELKRQGLKRFFRTESFQQRVQRMIAANILRGHLGRLIELYILMDRAIYLKELGCRVEVAEFFEQSTSPRNIGILAFGAESSSQYSLLAR